MSPPPQKPGAPKPGAQPPAWQRPADIQVYRAPPDFACTEFYISQGQVIGVRLADDSERFQHGQAVVDASGTAVANGIEPLQNAQNLWNSTVRPLEELIQTETQELPALRTMPGVNYDTQAAEAKLAEAVDHRNNARYTEARQAALAASKIYEIAVNIKRGWRGKVKEEVKYRKVNLNRSADTGWNRITRVKRGDFAQWAGAPNDLNVQMLDELYAQKQQEAGLTPAAPVTPQAPAQPAQPPAAPAAQPMPVPAQAEVVIDPNRHTYQMRDDALYVQADIPNIGNNVWYRVETGWGKKIVTDANVVIDKKIISKADIEKLRSRYNACVQQYIAEQRTQ